MAAETRLIITAVDHYNSVSVVDPFHGLEDPTSYASKALTAHNNVSTALGM